MKAVVMPAAQASYLALSAADRARIERFGRESVHRSDAHLQAALITVPIEYAPDAAVQLDALEQSADDQTWDAICDVLIDRQASGQRAGPAGKKIPARSLSVDDLAVLWSRGSAGDYVVFVGVMPTVW